METDKTKSHLLRELKETQRRLAQLEAADAERKQAERQLRESEEKYRAIFEQASDSVVLIDRATTEIVDFNDQAYQNLGYTREEFAGLKVTDINPFVSTEDASRRLNKLAIGEPSMMETKHRTKSGEIRDVIVTVRALDIGGKRYTIGIWHDITERKQAEKELREAELKYRIVADNTYDWEWWLSPAGEFTYSSPSCRRITGYDASDFMDNAELFRNIIHPADLPAWDNHRRKIQQGKGVPATEFRILNKDGSEHLIEHICQPVFDDAGKFLGSRGSNRDITERKQAEQALRESEAKYRAIFEQAVDSIALIDMDSGKILDFNDTACRSLGYTREEFARLRMTDISPTLHMENIRRKREANLTKKGADSFETTHRTKSGEIRDVGVSLTLVRLGGRDLVMSIWHDITEAKRVSEALRESEAKYRAIFEQAVDSIALIDIDSDKILEFNDKACEGLGYTREEFTRLRITDIDPDIGTNNFRRARETHLIKDRKEIFEARHRTKNGEIRDVRISATLTNPDGGNIAMCIWHDITEEKRMAAALRESEEKYRAIFEHAARAVVLVNLQESRIVDFNESAYKNLGYTREEFAKLKISDFDILQTEEDVRKRTNEIRKKGEYSFETKQRTKSGEIRDIRVYGKNFNIGGESFNMAIWHDITEEKRAEEKLRETETLKEIDRLRNQLLANVSHELRTPLASIKGFATMFLEYDRKLKSHEKRGYMETINRNVDRLTEFVDQLLDMSRLDAGVLPLDKRPASLSRLLREATTEARVRTPSHHFTLDLTRSLPRLNIDAKRIRQVLDNCISNAVNYSPAGTEITVSARKANQEIMITITDRGIGIPEDDLPYVFDRMFRSRRRRLPGGGVGLGLSISKGLVQAHGGRIWVESEEGKGCRCFFTLPQQTKTGSGND